MDFLNFLEELRTPFADTVFSIITFFGEELLLLTVMCVLYWCLNKNFAYRIAFSYFVAGLTVQTLKVAFRVPRPWIKDPTFKPVGSALETATGYSFPSGHTSSATTLFSCFALRTKKTALRILCFVMIALVMLSRMYLGVHTPQDVLCSFAISLILVLAVHYLLDRIKINDRTRPIIMLVFIGIAAAVLIYTYMLYGSGTIEEKYVLDCCKASGAGIGFAIGWYFETKYINFDEKQGSLLFHIIKLAIGLAVVLALKSGIKIVFGDTPLVAASRYFLMIIWAMLIYPLLLKKYSKKEIY